MLSQQISIHSAQTYKYFMLVNYSC
jgi:hypothetical protein